jgi:hypothetical protein
MKKIVIAFTLLLTMNCFGMKRKRDEGNNEREITQAATDLLWKSVGKPDIATVTAIFNTYSIDRTMVNGAGHSLLHFAMSASPVSWNMKTVSVVETLIQRGVPVNQATANEAQLSPLCLAMHWREKATGQQKVIADRMVDALLNAGAKISFNRQCAERLLDQRQQMNKEKFMNTNNAFVRELASELFTPFDPEVQNTFDELLATYKRRR